MEGTTLGEIGRWVGGSLHGDVSAATRPRGVSTDSRTLLAGDVFVALRGPNFDANQFVAEALDLGACAAIVDAAYEGREFEGLGPLLKVADTLRALGQIAKEYRKRFDVPVIAITGSSGKTTTKEMVAAVLERQFEVLKTPDSENNEIGVPKTILELTSRHEAVVLELAARRLGDIRYLCEISQPTIGVLLNIGTAHLEFFETVEGVAKAKGELLDYISDESLLALVNADDCVVAREVKRTKGRLLGFGLERESRYSGEGLVLDQEGRGHLSLQNIHIDLKIAGRHNVYNALAAAAVGDQCGVSAHEIGAALSSFEPLAMRSEILRKNGIFIINDCYNANPGSAGVAITMLGDIELPPGGRRIAVFGDMLELGAASSQLHAALGTQISAAGVDLLLVTGAMSRFTVEAAKRGGADAEHFVSKSELAARLCGVIETGDAVLLKASRGMAFEEIVDRLMRNCN